MPSPPLDFDIDVTEILLRTFIFFEEFDIVWKFVEEEVDGDRDDRRQEMI